MTMSRPMSGCSAVRKARASLSAPMPRTTVAGTRPTDITPGLDQGGGGGRRVRAVEDDISILDGESLEASGPARAGQSGADGRLRHVNAGRGDDVERRKRGARVLDLMWARDSERKVRQGSPWSLGLERAPGAAPGPISASDLEGRADLPGHSANGLFRGWNLRARDGRNAPPQDPRLLPGDVGVGRTEDRGVLEVDAGDDGNDGIDHVGRVVAAAQTDLDDRKLAAASRERVERHRGEHLEGGHLSYVRLRRLQSPRRGSHGTRLGGEFIVGKWLAVDCDAFGKSVQMRRSVESDSVASLRCCRGDEGAGRSFSFGSGDVNRGNIQMGIPERRQ